jgi:hypothetical protein
VLLPLHQPSASCKLQNDILFRNNSTGDTWFASVSNGSFNGWNHLLGSDPTYSVPNIATNGKSATGI